MVGHDSYFHFLWGEATITPTVFACITGLPSQGAPLELDLLYFQQGDEITELLREEFAPSFDDLRWDVLSQYLRTHIKKVRASDSMGLQQLLRTFLFWALSTTLFTNVRESLLPYLPDLKSLDQYDWGGSGLAICYWFMDHLSWDATSSFTDFTIVWEVSTLIFLSSPTLSLFQSFIFLVYWYLLFCAGVGIWSPCSQEVRTVPFMSFWVDTKTVTRGSLCNYHRLISLVADYFYLGRGFLGNRDRTFSRLTLPVIHRVLCCMKTAIVTMPLMMPLLLTGLLCLRNPRLSVCIRPNSRLMHLRGERMHNKERDWRCWDAGEILGSAWGYRSMISHLFLFFFSF